jgi:hypothetical protein
MGFEHLRVLNRQRPFRNGAFQAIYLNRPCGDQARKSTVIQLRARLKTLGLPTASKKDALIERLAGDAE